MGKGVGGGAQENEIEKKREGENQTDRKIEGEMEKQTSSQYNTILL